MYRSDSEVPRRGDDYPPHGSDFLPWAAECMLEQGEQWQEDGVEEEDRGARTFILILEEKHDDDDYAFEIVCPECCTASQARSMQLSRWEFDSVPASLNESMPLSCYLTVSLRVQQLNLIERWPLLGGL
eukprot:762781-Hanusia_phi.AAC.15